MADSSQRLPPRLDVPIEVAPGATLTYDLDAPGGGRLQVSLTSGDLSMSVQNDSQTSTVQSSVSGSGAVSSVTLGSPGGELYHLSLASQGGAQATLNFDPDAGAASTGGVSVSSSQVSATSGNVAASSSSSSVDSQSTVIVSSGGADGSRKRRIAISGGRIILNDDQ